MIINCLFGSAFEHKNSSTILKSFPKHHNSGKIPKKLKDFLKKLKADPKKLKEKLLKLKNPPTRVEMGWRNWAKKKPDYAIPRVQGLGVLVVEMADDGAV